MTDQVSEDTSDGFHTFRELYAVRLALTAALFRALAEDPDPNGPVVWRSRLHHDGELPFGAGWFITGADLPGHGPVTFHYPLESWDVFSFPGMETLERAPVWDGHDTAEVIRRLTGWASLDGPGDGPSEAPAGRFGRSNHD